MIRFHQALFVVVILALVVSCIDAPYPDDLLLQHLATLAFLPVWFLLGRSGLLSVRSHVYIAIFMLLHILGARYLYSDVPYDHWSSDLFGIEITKHFHFKRNHYDRVVHFAFGLFWVRPVWEVCVRYFRVPRGFAYYTAFEFVLAFSMIYELIEWGVAIVLSAEDADSYNGQQGDMWDAQKDMMCALVGAGLAVIIELVLLLTKRADAGKEKPANRT